MNKADEAVRNKEEQAAKSRADLLRVSYTDSRQLDESSFYPDLLSLDEIDRYKVVPVSVDAQQLQVGFSLQTPQTSLEELPKLFPEHRVFFTYLSQSGFDALRQRHYEHAHRDDPKPPSPHELADQLADQILETHQQLKDSTEIDLFGDTLDSTQQSELFNFIAQQAYLLDSSDVHIEPEPSGARIRFRIDGRLHVVGRLTEERYKVLLNEIQMQAHIRWNADYPQTGSTKATLIGKDKQNVEVNMRVETVPTLHGSDVVVRIFNLQEEYLSLDNLGLSERQREVVDTIVSRPHGLVLTVGPTGSGKSSTLYSILHQLNSTEVKIITLEDPVEYQISGITQIPVVTDDKELDTDDAFMTNLRAVMREDPDIIMIGEIRDKETARTALQASLTGHLVLSTFHATNGAAALSRLLDLIDYNPLLASAIRLIMPQRLLRRLCEHCKVAYTPDPSVIATITKAMQGLPDLPAEIMLYKPVGCDQCHNIGYQGRLSILEQFEMSPAINEEISSNRDLSVERLQELAISEGMITMLQDGITKALGGETSIEEVLRVVDL
ncbi:MAG: GspE/PulE family protein [Candidatus Saccharimonadales bacterium]